MIITSDRRIDPNEALQLLLDVGHEQSVESLSKKLIGALNNDAALLGIQIWLKEPGEQASWLELATNEGLELVSELDKSPKFKARIPLNAAFWKRVVATGETCIFKELDPVFTAIISPAWLKKNRPRVFMATPLFYKNEVLGGFFAFSRREPPAGSHPWSMVYANHVAAGIASARAFEEIQRLKNQLELQNEYLQEEVLEAKAFGALVGQSSALRQIINQIELVAPTEASVLILGETGTGKELVAHEIHRRSSRKDAPLVRVNCGSIPKELFESEFFGHAKGAFTGAFKDRAGRFEAAAGGTIFLDEVGELPLEMQSKLLRVLQERCYERVGEDHTRTADVRVISATNQDLKKAVAEGHFREDLYYRIHVFPIEVPPLKKRTEDIPLLAQHFIEISVKELRCRKPRLTRAAITALQNYDWPGNIRELRNVIERAVILAQGGPLHFDLPVSESITTSPVFQSVDGDGTPSFFTEAEMVRKEKENLVAVLTAARWKVKGADGAAELLGVKPNTLLARMKTMGIKRPGEVG